MNKVIIYTDGSSKGNPGPGGWGSIIISPDKVIEIGGRENMTTNNRMELTSAIEALKNIDSTQSIIIFSDSQYVIKGITEWIHGWIIKGWKNSQKKAVLNRDLWEELLKVSETHDLEWHWIKGHSGHPENERADELANEAIDRLLQG